MGQNNDYRNGGGTYSGSLHYHTYILLDFYFTYRSFKYIAMYLMTSTYNTIILILEPNKFFRQIPNVSKYAEMRNNVEACQVG